MSKELEEAWITIYHYNDEIIHDMGSEYIENPLEEEIDIVNNALLELKAIKEANPSEALECVSDLENFYIDEYVDRYDNNLQVIKQALLKAQEPKKCLKWEDLEFTKDLKKLNVKMGNNQYKLRYTLDIFNSEDCFLCDDEANQLIKLYKQFFNDLHLERVE